MGSLLVTVILAFVVVGIAIALLGLSWLITGKSKIRGGTCGRDPTKNKERDDSCGTDTSCSLCQKPDSKEKK